MEIWHKGRIDVLFNEAKTLQSRLPEIEGKKDLASISKRFKAQMERTILPLNDETLSLLVQKHPGGREMNEDFILQGPTTTVNPIVSGVIDESRVLMAAQRTKGGSGPPSLDADS